MLNLLGKKIKLKGITQKGKNRIRENGDIWVILAETQTVLFAPNESGPWLFISPPNCDQTHKSARWIRSHSDKDFELVASEDLTSS